MLATLFSSSKVLKLPAEGVGESPGDEMLAKLMGRLGNIHRVEPAQHGSVNLQAEAIDARAARKSVGGVSNI